MEYGRQGSRWVIEMEESGKEGSRVRVVKVGVVQESEGKGLAVVGVYGPQRDKDEELEEFYEEIGERVPRLQREGWEVCTMGDFNVEWKVGKKTRDTANEHMEAWRERTGMRRR